MPGVRIAPSPDRAVPDNSLIVVRDISRPFAQPRDGQRLEDIQPVCSACGVQHFHKTYHLQLDEGAVIVSEIIWAKLQAMPDNGGFTFVNYVEKPPAQSLTPGRGPLIVKADGVVRVSPVKERGKNAAYWLGPNNKTALAGERR